MSASSLHFLPLIVFLIFPITFATTYAIALGNDHIVPFFAYISDTGTLVPEMNVFAQLLNIAGVFIGFTSYIRYKQVEDVLYRESASQKTNKFGFFFGLLAALGVSVVGNFQESNILSVHVIGAFMAFGGGSIFLIFQAYFSLKMAPICCSQGLAIFRMVVGVACFLLFVLSYSTGAISVKHFTGQYMLKWKPEDGAWGLRVTSTVSEWVMASLFDLYFLTLVPEFRKISYESPKFRIAEVSTVRVSAQNGHIGKEKTVVMHRLGNGNAGV